MDRPPLPDCILPLQSPLFIHRVHIWMEKNGTRGGSYDECGHRWSRLSPVLQVAPDALTAALCFRHVDLQVEVDMRSNADALLHTFSDELSRRCKRIQNFIRRLNWGRPWRGCL